MCTLFAFFEACGIIKGACKFCVNKGFVSTKVLDCGHEYVISRMFLLLFDLLFLHRCRPCCCFSKGLISKGLIIFMSCEG